MYSAKAKIRVRSGVPVSLYMVALWGSVVAGFINALRGPWTPELAWGVLLGVGVPAMSALIWLVRKFIKSYQEDHFYDWSYGDDFRFSPRKDKAIKTLTGIGGETGTAILNVFIYPRSSVSLSRFSLRPQNLDPLYFLLGEHPALWRYIDASSDVIDITNIRVSLGSEGYLGSDKFHCEPDPDGGENGRFLVPLDRDPGSPLKLEIHLRFKVTPWRGILSFRAVNSAGNTTVPPKIKLKIKGNGAV